MIKKHKPLAIKFANFFKLIAVIAFLPSCSNVIFETQPHPIYYTIEYETKPILPPASCHRSEKNYLMVWDFDSSNPYETTKMVVLKGSHKIERSSKHQWICEPATLLKDKLLKDLENDRFVMAVIPWMHGIPYQYNLTGRIEKWAWVESKKHYHAEISVLLQVWSEENRKLIFKKVYTLQGPESNINTPDAFVSQISQLVRKLSERFRRDFYTRLCEILAR